MSRWRLSRRAMLRGAGVALALPWLEAMLPRRSRATPAPPFPKRFLGYFVPNGLLMEKWSPNAKDTGTGYALPPYLQILSDYRHDFSVFSNIGNPPSYISVDGSHATGTSAYLTVHRPKSTVGADVQCNISIDQILANAWRGQTRFASLELSTRDSLLATPDRSWSSIYNTHMSWATPTQPMPLVVTARAAFDRLFNVQSDGSPRQPDKSILDYVSNNAQRLKSKLGVVDQRKLDEYFSAVRDVEASVVNVPAAGSDQAFSADQYDYPAQVKSMMDIIALAFQTDSTRVITYMFGYGGCDMIYPFLNITSSGHHALSHHDGDPTKIAQLDVIDTWEMQQFAYLLGKLKGVQEGDGTLLDNLALIFSSDVGDGNTHTHNFLPLLVAGRAGGTISPGQHVYYSDNPPLENLHATLLEALGVPQTALDGRPTKTLSGILA